MGCSLLCLIAEEDNDFIALLSVATGSGDVDGMPSLAGGSEAPRPAVIEFESGGNEECGFLWRPVTKGGESCWQPVTKGGGSCWQPVTKRGGSCWLPVTIHVDEDGFL